MCRIGSIAMNEELIEMLESTANLMRGMQFDPSIPSHAKDALRNRYEKIEELLERINEPN